MSRYSYYKIMRLEKIHMPDLRIFAVFGFNQIMGALDDNSESTSADSVGNTFT